MPFRGIRQSALAYHVFRGTRPPQPENALAIGFSDSLWSFTQRCWEGPIESRPKVGEIVTQLKEAATRWDGLMPPRSMVEDVVSGPEEIPDSKKYSEFQILVVSWYRPPSNSAGGAFQPSSVPASPTESQTSLRTPKNTPPAQFTEPQKGFQEAVDMVSKELQPESRAPTLSEEPHGSLTPKNSSHLNQRHDSLPSQKSWNGLGCYVWDGLRHYLWKVIGFFGIWR